MSENSPTTPSDTPSPSSSEPTPPAAPTPAQAQVALKALLDSQAARTDIAPAAPVVPPPVSPPSTPDPMVALQERVNKMEQADKDRVTNQAWADEKARMREWVKTADNHPHLKELGEQGADILFSHTIQHYNNTGQLPSEEESRSHVEKQLAGMREKLSRVTPPEPPKTSPQQPEVPTPTNADASSVSTRLNSNVADILDIDKSVELMLKKLKYSDGTPVSR